MDKNLINIDDLVRQRLMGGEEQERPGAWLRMSDLLEKELPKARPVGFTWRRMFGAGAILLLISALSVGGYEMNAYMNRSGNTNAVATSTPSTGSVNAPGSNNTNSQPTTTTATDNNNEQNNNANNQDKNNQNKNSQPLAANVNHTNNKSARTHLHKTAIAANTVTIANPTDATNNSKVVAANNNSVENKKTGAKAIAANTTTTAPTDATNSDKVNDANNSGTENKKTSHVATKGTSTHRKVKSVDNTESKDALATKTTNKTLNKESKDNDPAGTTVNKTGTTGDQVAVAGKTPGHKAHSTAKVNNKTKLVSKTGLVLSSGAPKAVAAKQTTSKENKISAKHTAQKTSTNTIALNSHPGTAKNAPVAKVVKPVSNKTSKTTVKKDATAVATNKGHDKHVVKTTAKTGSPVAKKDGNDNSSNDVAALNPQRAQRVIPRMVIQERMMKVSPLESNYHLDTISFGNFTEDYDLPTALKPNNHSGAKEGGNDLATNNQATTETNPTIKPGSAAKDEESSSSKENVANKKSAGQRTVENLSAAFNDVKMQAGHATFASGITGGINGTFFGPNSFKGFQFGMTGKFTFSDVLAIMGELKYVHRINNGYSLNDNYYDYTPVAGGYSKQLVDNPYSISTLHSIELPITVRYCINNFNFFVGGNFSYMFAINTGDYPTVATNVPATTVQTEGNDFAPKIRANDFNSRFGIGYTFGASYQVSPKVTLDLRDVQTFWDNSKTEGAKYISSQLYKSPSFQLSIGYRFGGEKKDKE